MVCFESEKKNIRSEKIKNKSSVRCFFGLRGHNSVHNYYLKFEIKKKFNLKKDFVQNLISYC